MSCDVDLFEGLCLGLDASQSGFHVGELALHGERERGYGTLHALEDIHA